MFGLFVGLGPIRVTIFVQAGRVELGEHLMTIFVCVSRHKRSKTEETVSGNFVTHIQLNCHAPNWVTCTSWFIIIISVFSIICSHGESRWKGDLISTGDYVCDNWGKLFESSSDLAPLLFQIKSVWQIWCRTYPVNGLKRHQTKQITNKNLKM